MCPPQLIDSASKSTQEAQRNGENFPRRGNTAQPGQTPKTGCAIEGLFAVCFQLSCRSVSKEDLMRYGLLVASVATMIAIAGPVSAQNQAAVEKGMKVFV